MEEKKQNWYIIVLIETAIKSYGSHMGDNNTVVTLDNRNVILPSDDVQYVHFDAAEYTVFITLIGVSTLIGIYYGFYKGNQNTVTEYMLGGKNMSVFPVAMSLIVSHVSGITLLGVPVEIYYYGSQLVVAYLTHFIVIVIIVKVYLPVFYNLQVISANEYLELRFNAKVRKLASLSFGLWAMLVMPVFVYVPSLAFNQVTGIDIHVITPIVCIVCIFYTMVGGFKTVVWTDTIQSLFFVSAVIAVTVIGTISVGGVFEVFRVANKEGRIVLFNMDPNPFERLTFWSAVLGDIFIATAYLGTHAGCVQKFLSLPSLARAKWSAVYLALGVTFINLLSSYCGLLIFTKYKGCDPMLAKAISRNDQLLPYFVMDVARSFKGLPGLFIAGIVSASLGSMSASLNTLAGIFLGDFIEPIFGKKFSEATASRIMKLTVLILGVICMILVFIVEKLSTVYHLAVSFTSITNGALLGMFSLGMLFPWANSKGALYGAMTSVIIMSWIGFGSQLQTHRGNLQYQKLPVSTDACPFNVTISATITNDVSHTDDVFILYKLSFYYYVLTGCLIVLIVGLVVSYLTGFNDPTKLNRNLLSPVIHRFLPQNTDSDGREMYTVVPSIDDKNHHC